MTRSRPRIVMVLALVLTALPPAALMSADTARPPGRCPVVGVTSAVQEDVFFNPALRAYADRNPSPAGWTGGDATYSARLPDGRVAWVFADSFLGTVAAGGSRAAAEPLVHGSIVLQNAAHGPAAGLFTTTVSGDAFLPAAGAGRFRQPAAAVAGTVSGRPVLQVLVYEMAAGDRFTEPYGHPLGTDVATFSLGGGVPVRTGFAAIGPGGVRAGGPGAPPAARVTYGTSVLREGGLLYVYGHDWSVPARGYVARVPAGALARAAAWRYWTGGPGAGGGSWSRSPAAARPMTGALRFGYSVLRTGRTYVLFSMAPDRSAGLSRIVTYSACSPTGPWRGPLPAYEAGADGRARTGGTMFYNPHVHPEWSTPAGVLVSYDVNDGWPAVHGDVELYRPRFLRVRLGRVASPGQL